MPTQFATMNPDSLTAGRTRYDPLTMSFHWATLALIVTVFVTIEMRENAQDDASAALLILLHRSAGVTLWLLTLFRMGWRLSRGRSVPLPARTGRMQRLAAASNHLALYALLILQPATGFLQSVSRGKPFALLGGTFPAVVARNKGMTHLFHEAHDSGANILLALIALHTLAALAHGLRRDGVLGAMLPFGKPARG